MTRNLGALQGKTFDLLIIGGGIVGAGIAWDASLRGFSCALVEQGDFASGTSSKTTKLIHGGIRYLENLDFKLVREAIRERQTLLQMAPQLVKPLPFLIPVVGNRPRPWPMVKIGVILYDLLAGRKTIQRHRFLNRRQLSETEPLLSGIPVTHGAFYTDAQMDDSRLVLETLKTAAEAGAVIAHYCSVIQFHEEGGQVTGARVEDRLSGTQHSIQATRIVNATGPWVDRVRRLAHPAAAPLVRPSKGIHLLYPGCGLKHALLLSSQRDRRIFFLIPWRDLTLIGTTDTDYSGDPAQVQADREEVQYLLEETNRLLPDLKLERSKVIATFAGVRPLVLQEKKDPWAVSRMHLIHEDPNGLVSIVGGKYTTFRKIAEDVVDWCAVRSPKKDLSPCRTAQTPLNSGTSARSQKIFEWIQADPTMTELLCPHHPFIKADVRYAVHEEMAVTLSDLLCRRLGLRWSTCQGIDTLEHAGQWMGEFLGWSSAEVGRQRQHYQEEISAARTTLQE